MEPVVVEGGDRGCGELLLLLYRWVAKLPPGSVIAIRTTDPAAPIDLPVWCHLTGHTYLGPEAPSGPSGSFLVRLQPSARQVDPDRPWHLAPTAAEGST